MVNLMTDTRTEALWIDFPKTLPEFEKRFPDESACYDYLLKLRWEYEPVCPQCGCQKTWKHHGRKLFECSQCGHQTSLTANTLMASSKKPLKLWFRAIWEVSTRKNGVSGKDLQRILGFGSYQTAWTWLHKIRKAMVRKDHAPLRGEVEMDEGFIGGKGADKSITLVGVEPGGRIRLKQVSSNTEAAISGFAEREIDEQAQVRTDGLASYNARSLGKRSHKKTVQTQAQRKYKDDLQHCHWAIANLKRWLLGTHHGAVSPKHLQSYLDEFTFRYNRRKTKGVGRLVARALEQVVIQPPLNYKTLVRQPELCG